MELVPLTPEQWGDGGNALKLLWLALLFVLVSSGSFLTAHAILPSAIASGTLPSRLGKLRPLFYVTAVLALAGVVVSVIYIIGFLDYLEDAFPRRYR